jgi:hypothetical protein
MKRLALPVTLCTALFSFAVSANECTDICNQDYKDCKAVAETGTAKQACEDDLKECKAQCPQ